MVNDVAEFVVVLYSPVCSSTSLAAVVFSQLLGSLTDGRHLTEYGGPCMHSFAYAFQSSRPKFISVLPGKFLPEEIRDPSVIRVCITSASC